MDTDGWMDTDGDPQRTTHGSDEYLSRPQKNKKARIIRGKGVSNFQPKPVSISFDLEQPRSLDDEMKVWAKTFEEIKGQQCDLEKEVKHLCSLADLCKRSAVSTQSTTDLLRASCLYNYCMKITEESHIDLHQELGQLLINFEQLVLRRVLKLNPKQSSRFQNETLRKQHKTELKDIRDIYHADLTNLRKSVNNLTETFGQVPSQILEDKVVAAWCILGKETSDRIKCLVATMFNECLDIQDTPPATYTLIGRCRLGHQTITPFEPLSLVLIIGDDSPESRNYYSTTLTLFSMKFNNLGETGIQSLGIPALGSHDNGYGNKSQFSLGQDVVQNELILLPVIPLLTSSDLMSGVARDGHHHKRKYHITELLDGATFITGEPSLYQQALSIRQETIRQKTDKDKHAEADYSRLRELIMASDLLSTHHSKQTSPENVQRIVLRFSENLLLILFARDPAITAESYVNKIEELLSPNVELPYSKYSVWTGKQNEKNPRKLRTSFQITDEPAVMSKPPVKLPYIAESLRFSESPYVVEPHKKPDNTTWKHTTWTMIDAIEVQSRIVNASNQLMKKLRELQKQKRMMKDDEDCLEDSGSTLKSSPAISSRADNSPTKPHKTLSKSVTPKISLAPPRNQKGNGSRHKEMQDNNHGQVARFVTDVPIYRIRRGLIRRRTGYLLITLHSISAALQFPFSATTTDTEHAEQRHLEVIASSCLHIILQLALPLIEHLADSMEEHNSITEIIKHLFQSDVKRDQSGFITAMVQYYEGNYKRACQTIYEYLEDISDITFIGEPFPADVTEVCQELFEDNVFSNKRCESILVLMAQLMRARQSHKEAEAYWNAALTYARSAASHNIT